MTVVPKATFRRSLSYAELLDSQNGGPYVGLHLGEPGKVHVRRTAPTGYVETDGAPSSSDTGWVFAGLPHLLECLKFIESEAVDVVKLTSGAVLLRSVNSPFESELRVHTVNRACSGFKVHDPGLAYKEIGVEWLRGLNIKQFTLAVPPSIEGTKLVLQTPSGTIFWETEIDPGLPSSPRDTFLRALGDLGDGIFTLTTNGYFAACFNEMTFVIAGHNYRYRAPIPNPEHSTRLATVPAGRLIYALKSASTLAAPGSPITLSPRGGVVTRNGYGQPVRFGIGDLPPFMPFDLFERTGKLLADALEQTQGDDISMFRLPSSQDHILFVRGNCTVLIQGVPSSVAG